MLSEYDRITPAVNARPHCPCFLCTERRIRSIDPREIEYRISREVEYEVERRMRQITLRTVVDGGFITFDGRRQQIFFDEYPSTPNDVKKLNKGKGRKWRVNKYVKN